MGFIERQTTLDGAGGAVEVVTKNAIGHLLEEGGGVIGFPLMPIVYQSISISATPIQILVFASMLLEHRA